MSIMTREDRATLYEMHHAANGTGPGALKASRKRPIDDSSRSKGPWTQTPSIILPPNSSERYPGAKISRKSTVGSPFQQSQFDSLHDKAPRRNPSAAAAVSLHSLHINSNESKSIRPDNAPAHKKQRVAKTAIHKMKSRGERAGSPTGSLSLNDRLQETSIAASSSFCASTNGHGHNSRSSISAASDDPLRLPLPNTQSEVITIDDDEDLGVPFPRDSIGSLPQTPSTSSDDLRLIATTSENIHSNKSSTNSVADILGVPKLSGDHAFNEPIRNYDIPPPPSAGPHTRAVRIQVKNDVRDLNGTGTDELEAIEDADDFDMLPHVSGHSERRNTQSEFTVVPRHIVRQNVEKFEDQAQVRPPEIDLKIVGKNKPKVVSMKKKGHMSGKKGSEASNLGKRPASGRQDQFPPAPSLTTYKTCNKPPRDIIVPLEAYACGTRIVESVDSEDLNPKYWLRVRHDHVSILQRPVELGCAVVDLELEQDISGVGVPEKDSDIESFPLLTLTLYQTSRVKHFFGQTNNEEKMVLMMKPLISHVNWSVDGFRSIRNIVKSRGKTGIAYLRAVAFRSQWNDLIQAQDGMRSGPSQARVTRSKPHPQPNYAGAVQALHSSTSLAVRRSSRQATITKSPQSPSPPEDEIILLYPPTGPGAVNVTNGDIKRLEPGEFLNDTLIELGLKLWLNDLRDQRPEFADQVHVFSSFFYTQLNHKNFEEGYQSVRKWTSRFDLFKKKYIVVPINEHMHWYLAIICYPERILQHPPAHAVTPNVTTRTRAHESLAMRSDGSRSIHHLEQSTLTGPPNSNDSSFSIRTLTEDEQEVEQAVWMSPTCILSRPTSPSSSLSSVTAQPDHKSEAMEIVPETDSEGEDNVMNVDTSKEAASSSSPTVPSISFIPSKNFYKHTESDRSISRNSVRTIPEHEEEEEIDQLQDDDFMDVDAIPPLAVEPDRPEVPYIFSFDSLGTRHPHALKVLARYLNMEAKDKKGWADTVQPAVKQASVPAQPNYCDCGVYLLHFVEQFMSDPDTFSQQILQQKSKKSAGPNNLERERLWSHDKVAGKREEMKQSIILLSAKWRLDKQTDSKGKGNGEIEDQPREAATASADRDSDIEVVEMSPRPNKVVKPTRNNKAARLR